ncbi:PAS domain S-box-containing protein [Clostridium cavendishii DSM 21758]|uniref:histidine kinase n=1 Tax=Clostridium cavendishii DSM 21758 TaxID=1121302 RepID=A0A1M6T676_9CLOT|nr:HAMP domain-containing histidine kinase [Clostridium cavendishii]SHK52386.1 PAS domain S-box-containing protein [Clostridium cavendishii DSM 21758]
MNYIKTLKGKLNLIYISLIFIIGIVGSISVYNVYKLGMSIDGLITDNYKSIVAANNMNERIENEDKAVLKYLQFHNKEAIDMFYKSNDEFYKWLYVEKGNVTEPTEGEIVDKLNTHYVELTKLFAHLQEIDNNKNVEREEFYKNNISKKIEEIKGDLKDLSKANEVAMFDKKNKTKFSAEASTKIIFIVSLMAASIGLFLSLIYTNKYLKPIHLLADTIKSVKEGELNKQAPIIYNDEIGMLATEFNNMTSRLHEFEKSTKGTLLAEKHRSMTIVKSISDPLMVLDSSFKIKFINNDCGNFFSLNEEEVLNRHFLQVIKEGELYDHVFEIMNNNSIDKGMLFEITINNKLTYFNVTVTPIKDKDDKNNGVIVLFKNVTELKQLERIKTEFIGTISHELKTPLTSLMMGVGLMNDANLGALNTRQNRVLGAIKEDVQKLNDLVLNLLKISELESERAVFNILPVNIEVLIQSCVDSYKNQAEKKALSLVAVIEDNLPKVMVDEEKIMWVLNNLVSNAIRYTDENGAISIGAYKFNDSIKVYVQDTGRGIPEEYLERIFQKFVRVDGFEVLPESTGLGLSIVKEIVEAHGGEIKCESEVNKGSIFTFTIKTENKESER